MGRLSVVVFYGKRYYNAEETNTNAKEDEQMTNEKNTKQTEGQDNIEKPLFTGDYLRDTTVTEFEKAVEASNAIFNAIKGKLNGRKKNNQNS